MSLPLGRAVGVALLLTAVLLTGCEYKKVKLRLSDLDQSEIRGLNFWRLSEASGAYVRDGTVLLSPIEIEGDREIVQFSALQPDGEVGLSGPSVLRRNPNDPSQATLAIHYLRIGAPAWFRVSAFNDQGESPLSDEEIFL